MKKVIIAGVEKELDSLTNEELKQLFKDNRFNEEKLSDSINSFLPNGKEVTFTDFEFTSYTPENSKEKYAGINLIAKDSKDNIFNCTLSRLQMFGTIAKETDDDLYKKALVKQSAKKRHLLCCWFCYQRIFTKRQTFSSTSIIKQKV